jgi:hypothetical protein
LALIGAKENGVAVAFHLDPKADQTLADHIRSSSVGGNPQNAIAC